MGWSGMYSHLLWFLVMNCFFFLENGGGWRSLKGGFYFCTFQSYRKILFH